MEQAILGSPVRRREDPELLRGDSTFTADMSLPGMLHVAILHSSEAHALIRSIDSSAAEALPGVVRVLTGADLAGKLMPLPCIWKPAGVESHFPPHPYGMPGAQTVLATDRVRYVGDWVAVVIAETRQQAYAALSAIRVDYEPLPAVFSAEEAMAEGAPQLHESVPGNLCARVSYGDKEATQAAIVAAEVVVQQKFVIPRQLHNPIETRATLARYDEATGEYTLWTNSQIPAGNRFMAANLVLGIPYNKLRVIAPTIGGGYGSKGYLYQDVPLLLVLTKLLGRPLKWVDTRQGVARTTVHARGQTQYATLAGTRDGTITALLVENFVNLGGYPATNGPGTPSVLTGRSVTGSYAIANPYYEVSLVFANTMLLGPARGAGRMEAIFLIERMIDRFAREIDMDPADVRRKNLVRPEQFPYDNGLGWTYDSGNYAVALERALEMAGYADMDARKAEARTRGKRLGVGVSSYTTVAGVGPSGRMGLQEGLIGSTWGVAQVRIHPTGEATLVTGCQPHGQGQVTTLSQILASELGLDLERIEVVHSDTHAVPYAQGSYGSRSFSVEGAAAFIAAQRIKDKALKVGAHMLEAAEDDVVFAEGRVHVKGAPERGKTLTEIASALWFAWSLPKGVEPGLESTAYFDPEEFNFPFGSHVAVVEVDEATGAVELVRYIAVDDVGTVGNPQIVEGQMHGSITFGLGPALMEGVVFDEGGRVVSDSFRTYAVPRASQLPTYELDRTVTPTPLNPMGAKGAGDVSNPAVAPAVVNAICDALADLGVRHIDMPVTAEKVWRALSEKEA